VDAAKDREAAEEAGRMSLASRHEAEGAKAPSLASQTFATAVGKQGEAEATLKSQQFASARQRFLEAHDGFKRAGQEAQTATATLLARAEEARSAMLSARRDVDQGAASQYPAATKLFASAQAKERESDGAFARTEYAAAARLFGEARAEYQAAAWETNRQKELAAIAQQQERVVVQARQALEQSRSRMLTRRDEARKTDAGRLAKSIFDAAEKKRGEADALAARQSFADAGHGYQDAADLYLQAKIRAEDVGKAKASADSAKAQMQEAKQNARKVGGAATPYLQAESAEHEANALYERASYSEAADKYQTAKEAYLKAKPLQPPAPGFSG
jgi:hypothetical protein